MVSMLRSMKVDLRLGRRRGFLGGVHDGLMVVPTLSGSRMRSPIPLMAAGVASAVWLGLLVDLDIEDMFDSLEDGASMKGELLNLVPGSMRVQRKVLARLCERSLQVVKRQRRRTIAHSKLVDLALDVEDTRVKTGEAVRTELALTQGGVATAVRVMMVLADDGLERLANCGTGQTLLADDKHADARASTRGSRRSRASTWCECSAPMM
jgi:hypothetical protein